MYDSFDNTYQATIGIDFLSKTMYLEVTELFLYIYVSTTCELKKVAELCTAELYLADYLRCRLLPTDLKRVL